MSTPKLQTRKALWTSATLLVDEFLCHMAPHRLGVDEVSEPFRITHPIAGGDRCTIVTVPAETVLEIGRHHDPGWPEDPDRPFATHHALFTARPALLHQALLTSLRSSQRR